MTILVEQNPLLTYGKTGELVLLHVEFLEVVCPGEDAVWNPIAHIVLHVEGGDVDKLGRAASWVGRKLVPELVCYFNSI